MAQGGGVFHAQGGLARRSGSGLLARPAPDLQTGFRDADAEAMGRERAQGGAGSFQRVEHLSVAILGGDPDASVQSPNGEDRGLAFVRVLQNLACLPLGLLLTKRLHLGLQIGDPLFLGPANAGLGGGGNVVHVCCLVFGFCLVWFGLPLFGQPLFAVF